MSGQNGREGHCFPSYWEWSPSFSSLIDWEGCNLLRRLHVAWGGGGYPSADLWGEPGTLSTSIGLRDVNLLWQAEMIANRLQAPAVNIRSFCSWASLDTNIFYMHVNFSQDTFVFSIQPACNPAPPRIFRERMGNCSVQQPGNRDLSRAEWLHRDDHIKNQEVLCFAPSQVCSLMQRWSVVAVLWH